jgi:LacI family transcriptional regulator
VSKVLNQRPDVAPATRLRVEQIIAESGYIHHRPARLAAEKPPRQTKLLELITPDPINSEYGMEIIRGIEDVLMQTEYRLAFLSMHNGTLRERQWLTKVSAKTLDGALLLTIGEHTRHLDKLRKLRIPFVVLDDTVQVDPETPSVGATNWLGGLRATEYLLALGHRRIAMITGIRSHLTSMARRAGYCAALEARGLPIDPTLIRPGDFADGSGYTQTLALLALPEPPTAIFAASDLQAMGVYRALYEQGLRVPQDISVIGFDDVPIAERISPPLTTMRQPLKEMGRMATQMVLRMIKGEILENKRVELATSLVLRASCAPLSTP